MIEPNALPQFTEQIAEDIRVGDVFTLSGYWAMKLDPDRRWWQVWKPRYTPDLDRLARWKVVR